MRSSRVIALSKERDLLEWEEYKNSDVDYRDSDDYREKLRQRYFKYDPTTGPLKYAVYHERIDLLKLIFESGKYWFHTVILCIKPFSDYIQCGSSVE